MFETGFQDLQNLHSIVHGQGSGKIKLHAKRAANALFSELFTQAASPYQAEPASWKDYTSEDRSIQTGVKLDLLFTNAELNTYFNYGGSIAKIGTIKLIRDRLNMGLKEAKDYVEGHLQGRY